jgi:hypothetical protein
MQWNLLILCVLWVIIIVHDGEKVILPPLKTVAHVLADRKSINLTYNNDDTSTSSEGDPVT